LILTTQGFAPLPADLNDFSSEGIASLAIINFSKREHLLEIVKDLRLRWPLERLECASAVVAALFNENPRGVYARAAVSDAEFMWIKCVKHVNGFKKTVVPRLSY
jgi:hypothetical protein